MANENMAYEENYSVAQYDPYCILLSMDKNARYSIVYLTDTVPQRPRDLTIRRLTVDGTVIAGHRLQNL